MKVKGEPILIPCEGSGCPPAVGMINGGEVCICSMCGTSDARLVGGVLPAHERDDILARLKRGDFG